MGCYARVKNPEGKRRMLLHGAGRGGEARTHSKQGQGVPTWFTAVPLLYRVGGAFRGLDYVALGPQRHSERQRAPARMLMRTVCLPPSPPAPPAWRLAFAIAPRAYE